MRASVVEREKKAFRRQIIKDILIAIIAIACAYVGVWVAYFATF